jgi:uncharacterized protein YjbI with pentapeptide repeats
MFQHQHIGEGAGMDDRSPQDPKEALRRKAFIGRWKAPQGLVARARIIALLQSRRNFCDYHEIKDAAAPLQSPGEPTETGWVDLRGIDFAGLDLHECHVRADFTYGTFDGADLRDIDALYCCFSKASLRRVRGKGALLSGIVAKDALFEDADLRSAVFTLAILKGSSFQRANLERASVDIARVEGADFRSALLTDARFENTQISKAIFDTPMPEGLKR